MLSSVNFHHVWSLVTLPQSPYRTVLQPQMVSHAAPLWPKPPPFWTAGTTYVFCLYSFAFSKMPHKWHLAGCICDSSVMSCLSVVCFFLLLGRLLFYQSLLIYSPVKNIRQLSVWSDEEEWVHSAPNTGFCADVSFHFCRVSECLPASGISDHAVNVHLTW